jgi:hypothetical protein
MPAARSTGTTWLKSLLIVLLAFCVGALADALLVTLWVPNTLECVWTRSGPCDGVLLITLGVILATAPFVGLAFALPTTVWLAYRALRARPTQPADPAQS